VRDAVVHLLADGDADTTGSVGSEGEPERGEVARSTERAWKPRGCGDVRCTEADLDGVGHLVDRTFTARRHDQPHVLVERLPRQRHRMARGRVVHVRTPRPTGARCCSSTAGQHGGQADDEIADGTVRM